MNVNLSEKDCRLRSCQIEHMDIGVCGMRLYYM